MEGSQALMKKMRLIFIISLSLGTQAAYNIKVKIGSQKRKVEVSGTDITRSIIPLKSQKSFLGRKSFKFNCQTIKSSRSQKSIHLASLTSKNGLITFDNKKYLGNIHVVTSKNNESCDVVNEINIDQYISSLLSKEMNGSWPIEALKAQAVAARTYALNKIKRVDREGFYHLENSEKHQVNGDFFDVTMKTLRAAKQTAGYVLKNSKGQLVPAFFHASCGGRTLKPNEVWSNKVHGYHKGVNCHHCKTRANWQQGITLKRFKSFLKWLKKNDIVRIKNVNKSISFLRGKPESKVLRIRIAGKIYKIRKSYLRRYFGRVEFSSNNFYLADYNKKELFFVGKGRGHGVGMCQVGAKALADRGWSYQRILAHYFPDLKIKRVY